MDKSPARPAASLPGPKKKQAETLAQNVMWMAKQFGAERIGFLTLTCGDVGEDGTFVTVKDRKTASKRFNSLLTHVIRKRYRCGVVVTERHKSGGIHFHLLAVCPVDIRGSIDFEAVFPKRENGQYSKAPDYRTAPEALREEWAFWRDVAERYGFGRCQLQPIREDGTAVGRYIGKYVSKDWGARIEDDKGGRLVRYFGHWATWTLESAIVTWQEKGEHGEKPRRKGPPNSARFGWLTATARAWRECCNQVEQASFAEAARFGPERGGAFITEQTVADLCGRYWALRHMHRIRNTIFAEEYGGPATQAGIQDHNEEVTARFEAKGLLPPDPIWHESRGPAYWVEREKHLPLRPLPWSEHQLSVAREQECHRIADEFAAELAEKTQQNHE